jgi:hypothetical protein
MKEANTSSMFLPKCDIRSALNWALPRTSSQSKSIYIKYEKGTTKVRKLVRSLKKGCPITTYKHGTLHLKTEHMAA